jgi:(R)-2-hydroxyacyl-CoA dehydratese activating ATPase
MTASRGVCVAGIDVGSTLIKIAVHDGTSTATAVAPTQAAFVPAAAALLASLLRREGRRPEDLGYVLATGYGRRQLPFADSQVTEITCHARGVKALFPGVRTIVDIGGQDAKGIKLSPAGKVVQFVMNDKCAAGTGRFLDVVAATLGLTIDELGETALGAPDRVPVSSVCTIFAQQEVAQRLAEGLPREHVVAGLHDALASRVHRMVQRVRPEAEIVLTGGCAKNPGVVRFLEERLRVPVSRPDEPLVTGAMGAAFFAWDALQAGKPRRAVGDGFTAYAATMASREDARAAADHRVTATPRLRSLEGKYTLRGPSVSGSGPIAGVDVGSLYTKAVVIDGDHARFTILASQGEYAEAAEEALASTVRRAGIDRRDLVVVGATGLGGPKVPGAIALNDISCLAKGITCVLPGAGLAIDIGGQSTRAVQLTDAGAVASFQVSGVCAAGSARLLEVIAHLVGVPVDELGALSLRSERPSGFLPTCAVFAETEAITLLAQGVRPEDLLAGLHQSLAAKIAALAGGSKPDGTVAVAGGGARDSGLVHRLRGVLGTVLVPDEPMTVSALGAALLALAERQGSTPIVPGTVSSVCGA